MALSSVSARPVSTSSRALVADEHVLRHEARAEVLPRCGGCPVADLAHRLSPSVEVEGRRWRAFGLLSAVSRGREAGARDATLRGHRRHMRDLLGG